MLRKLLLLFAALPPILGGQTLARPNWSGSGLTVEPWYTHAVLYSVDPRHYTPEGTLVALTARLDYIRSLGVDAFILNNLDPTASLSNLDDLDTLIREANRDNLRVLIALPSNATPETARLYLTHNAAGIALPAANPKLQTLIHTFPGQRILITPPSNPKPDLTLAPDLPTQSAATLRQALEALQTAPNILAATAETNPTLATALLATHANTLLTAGQELGLAPDTPLDPTLIAKQDADPASLLNWVRSLIDLHHGSSALRSGTPTFLDHDAQDALVWVIRHSQVSPQNPALFVLCNLSDQPLKLSLTADLAALHLRGAFLRPVLRSTSGMGGQSLDAVTLLPHAVFLGELRF